MEIGAPIKINDKKCYSCGKLFIRSIDLERHKKRKSPCLIAEVPAAQIQNPNRCIFCNKIFANIGNKNKHLSRCKVKNGGMEILADKVRHEQELRILKEQNAAERAADRDAIAGLQKMTRELMDQIAEIKKVQINTQSTIIHGNQTNIVNNVQNIYNSYSAPNVDTLQLTENDLLAVNIAKKMIELIYFNVEYPENQTLYAPNNKEKRLLIFDNLVWKSVVGEELTRALLTVRNAANLIGVQKINENYDDTAFAKLCPVAQDGVRSFTNGTICATDDDVIELAKNNKLMVAKTMRENGVKM